MKSIGITSIGGTDGGLRRGNGWEACGTRPGLVVGDSITPRQEAGFELAHQTVLTARRIVTPPSAAQAVSVRALRSDEDWLQALENQILCRESGHDEAGYRVFKRRQMASYRKMAEDGWGEWFGAFVGEMLVADLGLYHTQKLGRYQSVGTHSDFRRSGIAANLVF